MSETEILDIVDVDGNVIGQAPRSEFHKNPNIIHSVVQCWIFNSKGQILWQQRSMKKAQAPGKWDMSCGGHVLSGQTPEDTLIKEFEEELNIKDAKTFFVEKYIRTHQTQTELIYLYYATTDAKESDFKLQEDEVEKVEWIDIDKAINMVVNKERDATDWIFTQVPKILQKVFSENFKK
jgi:isopentenyl-diphosphate delta-isomerase type 1